MRISEHSKNCVRRVNIVYNTLYTIVRGLLLTN